MTVPLLPRHIEVRLIRFATALLGVLWAIATVGTLLGGGIPWQTMAVTTGVAALVGGAMILTSWYRLRPFLMGLAVATAVAPFFSGDVDAAAGLAPLVIFGLVIVLVSGRQTTMAMIGYAVFLAATLVAWNLVFTGMSTTAVVATPAAFLFASYAIGELVQRAELDANRFQTLFGRAPLPLFEEDFSAVSARLEFLHRMGVTDLDAHLDEHPDELRRLVESVRVVSVNEQACRLTGTAPGYTGSLRPRSDAGVAALREQILAVWEGRDHITVRLDEAVRADGEPFDALVYWSAPRVAGRVDVDHVIVAIADVSEQRAIERHLEDSIRSRDQFVATVSHELRTPLTVVLGLAEELAEHGEELPEAERRELTELIAQQSAEVAAIVEDLLVVARTEVGSLQIDARELDLVDEARNALVAFDGIEFVPASPSAPAWGDPRRVRQILRNLLQNAHRYGGPAVRVVVGPGVVEVRDDGPPLPEDDRERMFDPYVRMNQRPGVTGSMGLGLSVSRRLASLMDGSLTYHHDGREAIFRLELPSPPAMDAVAS